MGERTQLVLKTKDRFGKVQNKVYHEQWGFAKTMPMIILDFLIQLNYGSTGQRKYVEKYNKPDIVTMRELNAMNKEEREETERKLQETSVHNLKLNSYDITEEYFSDEYSKRYAHTTEDGKTVILNSNHHKISKTDVPITEWDFDINNPNNVWEFVGDNNDGMAVISVEEKFVKTETGYRDTEYEVKIGFLTSLYEDEDYSDEKNEAIREANGRYHDLISYTETDREHYAPINVMNAIKELYEYFGVEELGKGIPLNPIILKDEDKEEEPNGSEELEQKAHDTFQKLMNE